MFSLCEEILFREFFLMNAVVGDYCDVRGLFVHLAKTFDIPAKQAGVLYNLTEQEAVREIVTEADSNRYKRIVQYLQDNGRPRPYDEQTDALITLKSEEISIATRESLCWESKTTKNKVYQVLTEIADGGSIEAMRIMGVLQLSGLFVERNWLSGKDYLVRAAEWGDVLSMFYLVRSGEKHSHAIKNFRVATQNTPYEFLYDLVERDCKDWQCSGSESEITLLNKIFNLKLAKKNLYSQPQARVLYATGISREDKEKILLSENKQLLSDVVNLPIYSPAGDLVCHADAVKAMRLHRVNEQHQIVTALQNSDLRAWTHYKPLCIAANSLYLQKIYAKAIENCFAEGVVSRIYVDELNEMDFEPTANNVFVRNCRGEVGDEHPASSTNKVYLLFLNGDVPEFIMKNVKDFLLTVRRRQFRLLNPPVTLDLSHTLPICICDAENADKLREMVETVQIADTDSEETAVITAGMLNQKAQFYFGQSVEITDNPLALLSGFSLESIEEIIDTAFRSLRINFKDRNEGIALKPFVEKYQKRRNAKGYGFGGYNQ